MKLKTEKKKQVLEKEVIRHTGNLIIEGNVADGAEIQVKDGSLIIGGVVGNDVKIKLDASEEIMKNAMRLWEKELIKRIGQGYSRSEFVIGPNGEYGDLCFQEHGKSTYIGNAKVGDRISTDGQLVAIHSEPRKYQILPQKDNKKVEATIDGKNYQGSEIIVIGRKVYVDEKNSEQLLTEISLIPIKCHIGGDVKDNVNIHSSAEIIMQNAGKKINIYCMFNGLSIEKVGEGAIISTMKKIKINTVGKDSKVWSQDKITIGDVDQNVELIAKNINITGRCFSEAKKVPSRNSEKIITSKIDESKIGFFANSSTGDTKQESTVSLNI